MKEVKIVSQEKVYEVLDDSGNIVKTFFDNMRAYSYALNNFFDIDKCKVREAVYLFFEGGIHDFKEDL